MRNIELGCVNACVEYPPAMESDDLARSADA